MGYGNRLSIDESSYVVLKINEDLKRGRILIFSRSSARKTRILRVPPLEAVESPEKVRVTHGLTFNMSKDNRRKGDDAHSSVHTLPPSLCAQALPTLLRELIALRRRYPERRILISKTDLHYAFRNVRTNPACCAQSFGYTSDDFVT